MPERPTWLGADPWWVWRNAPRLAADIQRTSRALGQGVPPRISDFTDAYAAQRALNEQLERDIRRHQNQHLFHPGQAITVDGRDYRVVAANPFRIHPPLTPDTAMPTPNETATPIPDDEADGSEGAQASICIPRAAISRAELRDLTVRVYSSDTWDEVDVYLISRTGLAKMVRAGWRIGAEAASRTVSGLIHVAVERPAAAPAAPAAPARNEQVMCLTAGGGWGGPEDFQQHLVAAVKSHLLKYAPPLAKRSIDIIDGRLRVVAPSTDPTSPFRVIIGSSGTIGKTGPNYSRDYQWGMQPSDPCRARGALVEWEDGTPILTSEGEEIAALNGNNLYIYQSLAQRTENQALEVFRRTLKEAAMLIASGLPAGKDAKEVYVGLCSRRVTVLREQSKEKIDSLTANIAAHQRQLIAAVRDCRREQAAAAALDQVESADGAKYAAEYEALVRLPEVVSVSFRGGNLRVKTTPIAIVDPRTGKSHDIGQFRIELNGESGEARFYNLTRQVGGYESAMHHPHVFAQGNACLGSLSGALPPLVAAYEFAAAVQLCIAFLSSVNVEDSAGAKIDRWPVVGHVVPPVVYATASA